VRPPPHVFPCDLSTHSQLPDNTFPALKSSGGGNPGRLQCGDQTLATLNSIWVASFDFTTGFAESLWCIFRGSSTTDQIQLAGLGLYTETTPAAVIRILLDYGTGGDKNVTLRSTFAGSSSWYGYNLIAPADTQRFLEIRWFDIANNGTMDNYINATSFAPISTGLIPTKYMIRGNRAYYAGYWQSNSYALPLLLLSLQPLTTF